LQELLFQLLQLLLLLVLLPQQLSAALPAQGHCQQLELLLRLHQCLLLSPLQPHHQLLLLSQVAAAQLSLCLGLWW
jgi:hypothetical protein